MTRSAVAQAILWIFSIGILAGADQPAAVFLHGGRDSVLPEGAWGYQGLLARELVRQALLCAARDELSCATFDLHIGQPIPSGAMEFDVVAVRSSDPADDRPLQLKIFRGPEAAQEHLATIGLQPQSPIGFIDLVQRLEWNSRERFARQLREAGVAGKAREWNSRSAPNDEALRGLSKMSFVSQFRAASILHAEIERDGLSPALVAALVRAYANLGVLTELHWAPAHDVFAARSLLYAQRLVVEKRDSTLGLVSRAYAFSLASLHRAALNDLDALAKLDVKLNGELSELTRILRSYCTFRIQELDPATCLPQHAELVTLLRVLAREHGGSERKTIEEALAARATMPHCYRIQAALGLRAGVALGHSATIQGLVDTGNTLYSDLIAFSNLPEELQAAIPREILAARLRGADSDPTVEIPLRAKAISAFRLNDGRVGEQGQLTWRVLGDLMAEHSFLETYVRARFEKRLWGVPPDAFLDLAQPIYQFHPMADVLDSFRDDRNIAGPAVARVAQIDLDTLELQGDELSKVQPSMRTAAGKKWQEEAHSKALFHMDYTAADLLKRYPHFSGERKRWEADRAFRVSPHAPAVRNHMVSQHWERVEPLLEQWLRDAAEDASQLAAIGAHYGNEKQWDKAIELFRRACDLSPEPAHIRLLADAYKTQGEMEKWQTTLEELLKEPDYALDHARVRVDIADYFIGRHEYEKALPFAEQAAETHAAWALGKAAECYEALQQWNEAEAMYRAIAERYDSMGWLLFVRRTGMGDATAAKRLARSLLNGPRTATATPLIRYGIYRALDDMEEAKVELENVYREEQPKELGGLYLALLADEQKDAARRDALLAELRAAASKGAEGPARGLTALVDVFSKDLAAGGKASFDVDALLAAKKGALTIELGHFDYLLGKYLQVHGQPMAAERIWLQRMSTNRMIDLSRTLCGMELLALGTGPAQYRETLQKVVPAGEAKGDRSEQ